MKFKVDTSCIRLDFEELLYCTHILASVYALKATTVHIRSTPKKTRGGRGNGICTSVELMTILLLLLPCSNLLQFYSFFLSQYYSIHLIFLWLDTYLPFLYKFIKYYELIEYKRGNGECKRSSNNWLLDVNLMMLYNRNASELHPSDGLYMYMNGVMDCLMFERWKGDGCCLSALL